MFAKSKMWQRDERSEDRTYDMKKTLEVLNRLVAEKIMKRFEDILVQSKLEGRFASWNLI